MVGVGFINVEKEYFFTFLRYKHGVVNKIPHLFDYLSEHIDFVYYRQILIQKKYFYRKYSWKNYKERQKSFFDIYFFKVRVRNHKVYDPYWNILFFEENSTDLLLNLNTISNFDSFLTIDFWFFQYYYFLLKNNSKLYIAHNYVNFEYVRYLNLFYEPILFFNLNLILSFFFNIENISYLLSDFKGFCCSEMNCYWSVDFLNDTFIFNKKNQELTYKNIHLFHFFKQPIDLESFIILKNEIDYMNKVIYANYIGNEFYFMPKFRAKLIKKYFNSYLKFDNFNRLDLTIITAYHLLLYFNNLYIIDLFTKSINNELITTTFDDIFIFNPSLKSLSAASVIFDACRQKGTLISLIKFDVVLKIWTFFQQMPKRLVLSKLKYRKMYQISSRLRNEISESEDLYLKYLNLWGTFFFPFFFWNDVINDLNFLKIFYLNFSLSLYKWKYIYIFTSRIVQWNIFYIKENSYSKLDFTLNRIKNQKDIMFNLTKFIFKQAIKLVITEKFNKKNINYWWQKYKIRKLLKKFFKKWLKKGNLLPIDYITNHYYFELLYTDWGYVWGPLDLMKSVRFHIFLVQVFKVMSYWILGYNKLYRQSYKIIFDCINHYYFRNNNLFLYQNKFNDLDYMYDWNEDFYSEYTREDTWKALVVFEEVGMFKDRATRQEYFSFREKYKYFHTYNIVKSLLQPISNLSISNFFLFSHYIKYYFYIILNAIKMEHLNLYTHFLLISRIIKKDKMSYLNLNGNFLLKYLYLNYPFKFFQWSTHLVLYETGQPDNPFDFFRSCIIFLFNIRIKKVTNFWFYEIFFYIRLYNIIYYMYLIEINTLKIEKALNIKSKTNYKSNMGFDPWIFSNYYKKNLRGFKLNHYNNFKREVYIYDNILQIKKFNYNFLKIIQNICYINKKIHKKIITYNKYSWFKTIEIYNKNKIIYDSEFDSHFFNNISLFENNNYSWKIPLEYNDSYDLYFNYELVLSNTLWNIDDIYNFFYYNINFFNQLDLILIDNIIIDNYKNTKNFFKYYIQTISPENRKNMPFTIFYLYFFRDFCLKFYKNTTNFHLFYNILNLKINDFNENNNNLKIMKEIDYSYLKYFTNYINYFEVCSLGVTLPLSNWDIIDFCKNFKDRIKYAFNFQSKNIIYWNHSSNVKITHKFFYDKAMKEREDMKALIKLLFPDAEEKRKERLRKKYYYRFYATIYDKKPKQQKKKEEEKKNEIDDDNYEHTETYKKYDKYYKKELEKIKQEELEEEKRLKKIEKENEKLKRKYNKKIEEEKPKRKYNKKIEEENDENEYYEEEENNENEYYEEEKIEKENEKPKRKYNKKIEKENEKPKRKYNKKIEEEKPKRKYNKKIEEEKPKRKYNKKIEEEKL